MPGTYKMIDVVGTSPESFAQAVKNAVAQASQTVRHIEWFEVAEMRGRVKENAVAEFQVKVRLGFRIEPD